MPWRPEDRDAELALEQPYEDVPDHLKSALLTWLAPYIENPEVMGIYILEFRKPWPDPRNNPVAANNSAARYFSATNSDPTIILTTIHWILKNGLVRYRQSLTELQSTLQLANSVYRLRADNQGLEHRITPGVREQVQATITEAPGSPGEHLTNAWNNAYGLNPAPATAYREAVMAVEAAGLTTISPKNPRTTLGTMIRDVRAKPSNWTTPIHENTADDAVNRILGMMQLLWDGQTRHGESGESSTAEETIEAARAAVHLSATLVQLFTSGAISHV